MRPFIILVLLYCFAVAGNAQQPANALPNHQQAIKAINTLNATARNAIGAEDRKTAFKLSDSALALSRQIKYLSGEAEALALQATIAQVFDDDFPLQEKLASQAIAIYANADDTAKIGYAYYAYAFSRFAQSDYATAIRYQQMSIASFRAQHNTNEVIFALITLSNIYSEKGVYDAAFSIAQEALVLARQTGNASGAKKALHMVATIYFRIGEYDSSLAAHKKGDEYHTMGNMAGNVFSDLQHAETLARLKRFKEAEQIYSSIDTSHLSEQGFRFYLVSKGEFELETGAYAQAIIYLEKGLKLHLAKNDGNEIMRARNDLAVAWLAINKTTQSLDCGFKALDLAKAVGSKQGLLSAYYAIYLAYQEEQKHDSALQFFNSYVMMKDSVMSAQTKGRIAAYTYEQTISRLNAENSLRDQQVKAISNERWLILLVAVIAIFLLIAIGRNMKLQRARAENLQQIAQNQLEQERLQNESKSAALETQKLELEMKMLRAQMNPHFIFNSLNSINMFILQNNAEQASAYLTLFSKLVRMILQNSRHAFISLEDEIAALRLYIEMEAMRFNARFDYAIIIPEDIDTFSLKVPPMLIQPFVENAIWHGLMKKAERGKLQIMLSVENNMLLYTIVDNGIGREKAKQLAAAAPSMHHPLGIRITSERISLLSRQMLNATPVLIEDLVDAKGCAAGTRVTIKIPLQYESHLN